MMSQNSASLLTMSRARASRVRSGATPLIQAAYEGRLDVVRALLNAGADKTIANKYGDKPIDVARLLATTPTCSTRTRSSLSSAEPLCGHDAIVALLR